jgi:aspartate/methionine/tyrosine aminotransferase
MPQLATTAQQMHPSGIREIMDLAAQIPDSIHLEVGEPTFAPAPPILLAAKAAIDREIARYTANSGLISLREKIAERLGVRGWTVRASQIVVTPGAVCALFSAIRALVDPGDEVLVPDPGWPNYTSMAQLSGGVPVPYPLSSETGYLPRIADLAARVSDRTKLLIINSPSNPTGAVFPPDLVKSIIKFAQEHDLYVISDEVYEAFVFEGEHQMAGLLDPDGRVVTISGFSKTYAMTGWRVGYAIASEGVAKLISRLQEPVVCCASAVSQRAAEAALSVPDDHIAEMCNAYRQRRDLVASILGPAGLLASKPHGSFYALVDLRKVGQDSYFIARDLLARKRVATAPGETFGKSGAGLIRISLVAAADQIDTACKRVVEYVNGY